MASKQTKVPRKPILKGRRGALAALYDAPEDVIYELAAVLHPLSLLNLARTNKHFRGLLMTKHARHPWKLSIAGIKLPPCPNDLTHPQYVHLIFNLHCHACGKTSPANPKARFPVIWEFRARFCKPCVVRNVGHGKLEYAATEPRMPISLAYAPHKQTPSYPATPIYLINDVQVWVNGFQSCQTRNERDAFLVGRMEEVAAIESHSTACRAWEEGCATAEANARLARKTARVENALLRLKGEGWGNELATLFDPGSVLRNVDRMWVDAPLTDKIWKNLGPKVTTFMKNLQADRMFELQYIFDNLFFEEVERILRMAQNESAGSPTPTVVDILLAPPALFGRLQRSLSNPCFARAFEPVQITREIIHNWGSQIQEKLTRHARASMVHLDPEWNFLAPFLAVVVWRTRDGMGVRYPDILSHWTVTQAGYKTTYEYAHQEPLYDRAIRKKYPGGPWSCDDTLPFFRFTSMWSLVLACGGEPRTETVAKMDSRNARVLKDGEEGMVYSWRTAVEYEMIVEPNATPTRWSAATKAD